jgi:hypothetical protein
MTMFKSILTMAAVLAMSIQAQAGLFGNHGCGAEKSCGCSDDCAPACCKPVIVRPCGPNIYTYQRACSNIKPPCCDNGCPATCCTPANKCCTDPGCAAPADPCCEDPGCAAPCDPGCQAPCDPACAAPCESACTAPVCAPSCHKGLCGGKKWFKGGLFKKFGHGLGHGCGNDCCEDPCCEDPGCAAPAAPCCEDPGCAAPCDPACAAPAACGDECVDSCCEDPCAKYDPCKLACLIYESQTACYAKDRAKAIDKIGDKYNCKCNPEIITAFVYALNDADHRVRRQAADEIGDQTRKYGCCCTPEVVSALTCTLADCDRSVRRQAERALKLCGYDIVDGCCEETCCEEPACAAPCDPACAAPAAGCNASYFPARLHNSSVAQPVASQSSLSNLFGMAN